METKRLFSRILFFVLILIPLPLCGEEFTQKIEWKSNANALEYRVEVQNIASGKTQDIKTDKTSAELSLAPGRYRYRVYAYDFLGREAGVSSWTNFEVFKANKPSIRNVDKKVNIKEDSSLSIAVDISGINKNSKFELVNESLEGSISASDRTKMSDSSSETGSITSLDFRNVPAGKWRLKVTNASGLSSLSDVITVSGEKTYTADEVAQIKTEAEDAVRREMQANLDEYIKNSELAQAEKERLWLENEAKRNAEREAAEKLRAEEEKRLADEEKARLEEEKRRAEEENERLRAEELERIAAEKRRAQEEKEAAKRAKAEWKAAHPYVWKDVIFEGGLGFTMNVTGDIIKEYFEETETIALNVRAMYFPVKFGSEKLGLELGFMTQTFEKESDFFTAKLESNVFDVKIVWQHKIIPTVSSAVKLGAGADILEKSIVYIEADSRRVASDATDYTYPVAVAGASVFFTPWKFLVFETGVDFTCVLAGSEPLGFVTPYACMGFRF